VRGYQRSECRASHRHNRCDVWRRRTAPCLRAAAFATVIGPLSACSTHSEQPLRPHAALSSANSQKRPTADTPGGYKIGQPYRIGAQWYVPREQPDYVATGRASWYGSDFHGRPTANGEIFDQFALTAAHPTLPLPSFVRVRNLANGRDIIVRVNDRGPFVQGRIIDMSRAAALALGFLENGTTDVRVTYIGAAPIDRI